MEGGLGAGGSSGSYHMDKTRQSSRREVNGVEDYCRTGCGEELSGASSTSTCQTRVWKMSLTNQFINNWGVEEPQKVSTSLPSDLNFENYLIDIYMENRSQTAFCKNKCCPLMQR